MSETDPWEPEATRTGTAPAITAEMIGTASMVIQRMYSSDDPGEIQSGRAVVQALYPLIAAAERRVIAERLRAEVGGMRTAKHAVAINDDGTCDELAAERALGACSVLDWTLAAIDRMARAERADYDEKG